MQASELRPGQFPAKRSSVGVWMSDEKRCESVARMVAIDAMIAMGLDPHDFKLRDKIITGISERINKTLDSVTGWDDEPAPAPLQLREGAWYRQSDGRTRGPLKPKDDGSPFVWNVRDEYGWDSWLRNGRWSDCHETELDLIAEVPPPVEPEQFKVGDWVTPKADDFKYAKFGQVYEVKSLESHWSGCEFDSIDIGIPGRTYLAGRFRRATPAEVAAHKQAQEPQQLKPTCLADGKSCDRNTACAGSVCAFFECQEPQPNADGWIEWKGGEWKGDPLARVQVKKRGILGTQISLAKNFNWHHDYAYPILRYRLYKTLVPSPQPAPIITDWVEVVTR